MRWQTRTEVRLEPVEYDALADFIPGFRFVLDDLAHVSDQALRDRTMVTVYARLALLFLKYARAEGGLFRSFRLFRALFATISVILGSALPTRVIFRFVATDRENAKK